MFGFGKVAGATSMVTQAIHEMLAPFKITGGLPLGFWRDPYVIGYLHGTIGMLAKLATKGALAGEKLGRVTINVFDNLVPGQGLQIVKMANDFHADRNDDFLSGMDKGSMAVAVMYGSNAFDDHPDVQNARAIARNSPMDFISESKPSETIEVGSMLQFLLFHAIIKQRLGEGH